MVADTATVGIDWGDIPTWIQAVATGLVLYLGLRTYRQSQSREIRAQASKVHVVHLREQAADAGPAEAYSVQVRNLSDAPIYDVWIRLTAPNTVGLGPLPEFHGYMNADSFAGNTFTIQLADGPRRVPHDMPQGAVDFRDADGYLWTRRSSGQIEPPINMRPRSNRVLAFLYRRLPRKAVHAWLGRRNRPPVRIH